MLTVYNSRSSLFQIIIQYVLNDDKKKIFQIPEPGNFNEFLKFSLNVQNNVCDKVLDTNKLRAYNEMYSFITHSDLCYKIKIEKFYRCINNIFSFNDQFIEMFSYYFFLCQKVYHNLIRFFRICKIKIKKTRNQFDLQDNPVNFYNSLPIIHNNELYLFSKNDIIKLFFSSLVNSNFKYSNDPQRLKNPYTNILFKKNHLYNMYFYIKNNSYNLDILITNFYKCDFKLNRFIMQYDNDITFLNIKRFINNGVEEDIYQSIRTMINDFNKDISSNNDHQIILYKYFPKGAYNYVFKPYLFHYLCYKNICNATISFNHWAIFKKKINRFCNKSHSFGRIHLYSRKKHNSFNNLRIYKRNNKTYFIKYNLDYIDFNKNTIKTLCFDKYCSKEPIINNNIDICEHDIINYNPHTPSSSDSDDDSINIFVNSNSYSYSELYENNTLIIQETDESNNNINQEESILNIDQTFDNPC